MVGLATSRRTTDEEIAAIEPAVDRIKQHQGENVLPQRIEAMATFFSSIALAGHNEALQLMAKTMTAVLRERMTHVMPTHPRPDVFRYGVRWWSACMRAMPTVQSVRSMH